jgi:hypothetical protein
LTRRASIQPSVGAEGPQWVEPGCSGCRVALPPLGVDCGHQGTTVIGRLPGARMMSSISTAVGGRRKNAFFENPLYTRSSLTSTRHKPRPLQYHTTRKIRACVRRSPSEIIRRYRYGGYWSSESIAAVALMLVLTDAGAPVWWQTWPGGAYERQGSGPKRQATLESLRFSPI